MRTLAGVRAAVLIALGLLPAPFPLPELHAAGCTVTSTPIAFGRYDVFSPSATSTTGTIGYTCTLPVSPPIITLSAGGAASFTPRALTTAGGSLQYNLFLDASCTTIWGDGTSGTSVHSASLPADGQSYEVPVYGRIPAQQRTRVGTYGDTVVLTIEF